MASTTKTRLLIVFTCLLTVVASGDDICLSRLVFVPALLPAPAETLPLDDPNSDFVRTTESVLRHRAGRLSRGDVGPAALHTTGAFPALADCCSPRLLGHAAIAHFPRADLNTPLRC